MTRFAASTEVTSARSRDEIERTLIRYGADQFMYGWQGDAAIVGFQMDGRRIKFVLPLPARDDRAFPHHKRGARTTVAAAKEFDQAVNDLNLAELFNRASLKLLCFPSNNDGPNGDAVQQLRDVAELQQEPIKAFSKRLSA